MHQFSLKIAFEKKILNDMFEEFMMYKIQGLPACVRLRMFLSKIPIYHESVVFQPRKNEFARSINPRLLTGFFAKTTRGHS